LGLGTVEDTFCYDHYWRADLSAGGGKASVARARVTVTILGRVLIRHTKRGRVTVRIRFTKRGKLAVRRLRHKHTTAGMVLTLASPGAKPIVEVRLFNLPRPR
jgi:hypothetical protein